MAFGYCAASFQEEKMTIKDYKTIAEALGQSAYEARLNIRQLTKIMDSLSGCFAKDNPEFDNEQFCLMILTVRHNAKINAAIAKPGWKDS